MSVFNRPPVDLVEQLADELSGRFREKRPRQVRALPNGKPYKAKEPKAAVPARMTAKLEAFCSAVVADGKSAVDAYIWAFGHRGRKRENLARSAWRVSRMPIVLARIKELRAEVAAASVMSVVERAAWLSGAVRVKPSELNADSEYAVSVEVDIETGFIKKAVRVDPIQAIKELNRMDGTVGAAASAAPQVNVVVGVFGENTPEARRNALEAARARVRVIASRSDNRASGSDSDVEGVNERRHNRTVSDYPPDWAIRGVCGGSGCDCSSVGVSFDMPKSE